MSLSDETSIVIVTHNHEQYVEKCLRSLLHDDRLDIIVVDNASTDKTVEIIENNCPSVRLYKNNENLGFGCAVNQGVTKTERKYLVILNPDTYLLENSIHNLIEPITLDENLITNPKVLTYDGSKINTCGNIEHFTGMTFTKGLDNDPDDFDKEEYLSGVSGVCIAVVREKFLEIGGFNPNYFLYMEDAELSWRATVNGLSMKYIPKSIIYHDYTLKVNPEKIYYLEKGRYIILRQYFTWKEYIMISPSLIMTEILTSGYSILNGFPGIKFKLKAIKDAFNQDVSKIDSDRRKLIKSLDYNIPVEQLSYNILDRSLKKISNFIYSVNYQLI